MFKKIAGRVVAVTVASIGIANAAVDTSVSGALGTAATDVAAVAALAFLCYLAPKAFKYMRGGL